MKYKFLLLTPVLVILLSWKSDQYWKAEKDRRFTAYYTIADKKNKAYYVSTIRDGLKTSQKFFSDTYLDKFDVFIHPGRKSLDSTWEYDWKMPGFKSECWMVASGVAKRLDILSPSTWDKQACDHTPGKEEIGKIITHELVHVFHAQHNPSPDFGEANGIDWFIEGLATYASGQLDPDRMKQVRQAIASNNIPASLDKFWSGNLKYGLSGSVVWFIDKKYGRPKLRELLPAINMKQVLSLLGTTEPTLLSQWKKEMMAIDEQ